MRTLRYQLHYSILADSRLEAIMKAGAKLRTGLRVEGVAEAEQGVPGWWDVSLYVAEDVGTDDPEWPGDLPEGLDPLTQAKGEHARWGL